MYIEKLELSEQLHLNQQQALKQRSFRDFLSLAVADFCAFRLHMLFLDDAYTERQDGSACFHRVD